MHIPEHFAHLIGTTFLQIANYTHNNSKYSFESLL